MTAPATEAETGGVRIVNYELRGANHAAFASTEHEVINSGSADTGKTFANCLKLHAACDHVPGVKALMARKTMNSLHTSIAKTFMRIVAPLVKEGRVRPYGGERPSEFIYPNGSEIWLGGMDNPETCLSSEWDLVVCCQSEELTLNDWELLSSRCSGRGAVLRHPQILGDCNPSGNRHWIRDRAAQGKVRLLVSTHKDNPDLYDAAGNMTPEGRRRLAIMESSLSGVRRKRLLDGIWATAEGAVYDIFDVNTHRCVRDPAEMVNWYLAQDAGYTHPAVVLLVGADSDKRLHVFREFYKRGVVPEDVVAVAAEWNTEKQCEFSAVDSAAAGLVASLRAAGVNALAVEKGLIFDGIELVMNYLKVQGDGKPRLTVDPSCVETVNEFESYAWKPDKDVPQDASNHSMDAIRYLCRQIATGTGAFTATSSVYSPPAATQRFVLQRHFAPRGH